MNTTTRPTQQQIEDARALTAHYAAQARRHDRNAVGALLCLVLALLAACALLWAWQTWAQCPAGGAALCTMALTPTRPGLWQRLKRTLRGWLRQYQIAWHKHDLLWLERDLEAARAWVDAAPAIIEARRGMLADLEVRHMAEQAEGVR